MEDFRAVLAEFVRVTRKGGRILLTTIGIWPYPPAVRLHRWSRRELEEVLSEFGEARVEENGGYLRLVPQLANAALAMGVEGYLVRRYGRAGRVASAPLKGVYLGLNLLALSGERVVRAAARQPQLQLVFPRRDWVAICPDRFECPHIFAESLV